MPATRRSIASGASIQGLASGGLHLGPPGQPLQPRTGAHSARTPPTSRIPVAGRRATARSSRSARGGDGGLDARVDRLSQRPRALARWPRSYWVLSTPGRLVGSRSGQMGRPGPRGAGRAAGDGAGRDRLRQDGRGDRLLPRCRSSLAGRSRRAGAGRDPKARRSPRPRTALSTDRILRPSPSPISAAGTSPAFAAPGLTGVPLFYPTDVQLGM